MELDFAILARRVETKKGMSHTEALGWKSYTLLAFPQVLDAALLLRVDLEGWESALPHTVEVFFLDEAGTTIAAPMGAEIQVKVGQKHFTYNFGLQEVMLQREGNYKIEICLDRNLVKTIPFKVKLVRERAIAQTPSEAPAPVPSPAN